MSEIDKYLALVTFTPAVVGYICRGNKILLGERIKVSHGLGESLIAGFGGKVGDQPEIQNETFEEAMDREAAEEIKIKIVAKKNVGRARFIFTHKPPDSKWNQDVRMYLITAWTGKPTETESFRPQWFQIDKIPWSRMWEDNHHLLPKTIAGESVNATFLYTDDNKLAEYRFEEIPG